MSRWVAPPPQELVDAGFLVAPRLHAPGVPDMVGAKKAGGDYTGADSAARMAPLTGDIIATWKANARELRTLVFASSVAHSRSLAEQFLLAGARVLHVDAHTPNRPEVWKRLDRGELDVVCNMGVAIEGIDVPNLENVIMARPTDSLTIWLQVCGRVMRPAGRCATIYDHAGNIYRHGGPMLTREWSLEGKTKRAALPPICTCKRCYYVAGAPFDVCPHCGLVRAREERAVPASVEGSLVEVD